MNPFCGRFYQLLPHFHFGILLLLSIIFYLERVVILDAAYQLWMIIYQNDLALLQGKRYGSVVTKIWPFLGIQLGLSLKSIMILYSASFVFIPYFLFLILSHCLKVKRFAWVLLLFTIFMVHHTFYWIQSELIQAIWLMLLAYGMIIHQKLQKWYYFPLLGVLIYMVFFTHPLVFIPFFYVYVFLVLDDQALRKSKLFLSLGLLSLGILIFKHFFLFAADYDTQATSQANNILQHWPSFFQWESNKFFFRKLREEYYLFILTCLGCIFHYLKNRKQVTALLKLGLMVLGSIAYIILINGTFYAGGNDFHVESFYLVLSIFVLFPLFFDVFPRYQFFNSRTFKWIFAILLLGRMIHIVGISTKYKQKINWTKELISKVENIDGQKFLLPRKDSTSPDVLLIEWGLPCETALLSALNDPKEVKSIVILDSDAELSQRYQAESNLFATPFGPVDEQWINKNYFDFEKGKPYELLNLLED